MQKHYLLLASCGGFVIGLIGYTVLGVYGLGLLFGFVPLVLWVRGQRQRRLFFCFLVYLCLGAGRASLASWPIPDQLAAFYDRPVTLGGFICSDVQAGYQDQRFVLCLTSLSLQSEIQVFEPAPKVQVTARLSPRFHFGDRVSGRGTLLVPKNRDGFDYQGYLRRRQITAVLKQPSLRLEPTDSALTPFSLLRRLRLKFSEHFARGMAVPYAGIAQAMILGEQRTIPDETYQIFVRSGVLHIIAISGSHITLFSGLLAALMPWFGIGRKRAFWLVGFGIFIYILMAGAPPSAVRAGMMGVLVLLARNSGREPAPSALLLVAAAIMLGLEPFVFYEVGFQLSFAAVWGIIVLSRKWQTREPESDFLASLHEGLVVTAAATLATLPLTLWHFEAFSLLSLVTNLLTLPLATILMVSLLVGLGASLAAPPLSPVFFLPSTLMLAMFIKISTWLAAPSLSYVGFHTVSGLLVICMGGAIFIYAYASVWQKVVKPS